MIARSKSYIKNEWLKEIKEKEIINIKNISLFLHNLQDYILEKTNTKTYVVPLTNGTSSLFLGFYALGINNTKKCLLPGFSYHAAKIALEYLGANIDYIDVSKETLCMNPNKLKEYLENNKDVNYVIFINHLGYIGEHLFEIKNICDYYKVELIEDSAQGFGHIYNGTMPGLTGKFGIYSFSGAKLLRCGTGGCFITTNAKLSEKVEELSSMGIGNYLLSPMLSIFLNKQLEDIDELIEKRHNIYEKYKKLDLDIIDFPLDNNTGYHCISYLLENKNLNSVKGLLNSYQNKYEFRYNFYAPLCTDYNKTPVSYYIYSRYIELPQSYDLENEDISSIVKFIKMIDR